MAGERKLKGASRQATTTLHYNRKKKKNLLLLDLVWKDPSHWWDNSSIKGTSFVPHITGKLARDSWVSLGLRKDEKTRTATARTINTNDARRALC
eukprot:c10662_g1_i1 orf=175-459(+)